MLPKRSIKIAFIGACCSGKTALVEQYTRRHLYNPDIYCVEEAARAYYRTHTAPVRSSKIVQQQIQRLAIRNEKKAQASTSRLILCDSAPIDTVVYSRVNGNVKASEDLFDSLSYWLPTYDKFLLLNPFEIPFVNDEIRRETEEDRARIHQIFIDLFVEKNIPYEFLTGTVDERVKKVDSILESLTTQLITSDHQLPILSISS